MYYKSSYNSALKLLLWQFAMAKYIKSTYTAYTVCIVTSNLHSGKISK